MTEMVDPLAMGAPPSPGVVIVPDPPAAPAPAADPLAGLFFAVIGAYAEMCAGVTPYGPCLRVVQPGQPVYKLPDGTRRCGGCVLRQAPGG